MTLEINSLCHDVCCDFNIVVIARMGRRGGFLYKNIISFNLADKVFQYFS